MTWAVLAAFGAASLFAIGAAVQHQEANAVAKGAPASLLLRLARRPLWLLGIAADGGAIALQAVAFGYGSVPLVQSLLVSGLPLAALLSALLQRRRMHRHEVLGTLLCAPGIALLAPALSATPSGHDPSRSTALLAGLVVAAVSVPLIALRSQPRFGGVYAGAAAGCVTGAGSVLLAVIAARFGDWSELFGSSAVYVGVLVGALGLLLAQIAFQTGDIGAPLAALTITEPAVAVALAVTVLHDDLPTSGASLAAAIAGAALCITGVLALCRRERFALPAAAH
ncbi:MAG: DMT family transporter [Mycobacteriales bacterium]